MDCPRIDSAVSQPLVSPNQLGLGSSNSDSFHIMPRVSSRIFGDVVSPAVTSPQTGEEAGEETRDSNLVSNQSQRIQARVAVTRSLESHMLQRFAFWMRAFSGIKLLLGLSMVMTFIRALFATCYNYSIPCDVPLNHYMIMFMVSHIAMWGVRPKIQEHCVHSVASRIVVVAVQNLPNLVIIVYGVFLVSNARTCQKTNPSLFYPVAIFIYLQLINRLMVLVLIAGGITFMTWAYRNGLFNHFLNQNHGNVEAVKALPKVEFNLDQLTDPDDGRLRECPICIQTFTDEKAIVEAPCKHLFHEECLARWCEGSVQCPLCRASIEGDTA